LSSNSSINLSENREFSINLSENRGSGLPLSNQIPCTNNKFPKSSPSYSLCCCHSAARYLVIKELTHVRSKLRRAINHCLRNHMNMVVNHAFQLVMYALELGFHSLLFITENGKFSFPFVHPFHSSSSFNTPSLLFVVKSNIINLMIILVRSHVLLDHHVLQIHVIHEYMLTSSFHPAFVYFY
jgi:hypothetical protein